MNRFTPTFTRPRVVWFELTQHVFSLNFVELAATALFWLVQDCVILTAVGALTPVITN